MGNKLRHEGDEVRIKVIWPDEWLVSTVPVSAEGSTVRDVAQESQEPSAPVSSTSTPAKRKGSLPSQEIPKAKEFSVGYPLEISLTAVQ
jgi:hypothetical protein